MLHIGEATYSILPCLNQDVLNPNGCCHYSCSYPQAMLTIIMTWHQCWLVEFLADFTEQALSSQEFPILHVVQRSVYLPAYRDTNTHTSAAVLYVIQSPTPGSSYSECSVAPYLQPTKLPTLRVGFTNTEVN